MCYLYLGTLVAISGDCEGLTNLDIKNGGKFLISNRIMYKYVTWKPNGVTTEELHFGKNIGFGLINTECLLAYLWTLEVFSRVTAIGALSQIIPFGIQLIPDPWGLLLGKGWSKASGAHLIGLLLGRGKMMENVKKMNEEIKKMKKMKEDEEDERIWRRWKWTWEDEEGWEDWMK